MYKSFDFKVCFLLSTPYLFLKKQKNYLLDFFFLAIFTFW